MQFISSYEGAIPGAQESKECGNYLNHDLTKAKTIAKEYLEVIKDWHIEQLTYPQ